MTSTETPVVLAVDDDEMVLETYELWLASAYDLRTATGGEEALERLDDDVDVVLLDRLMPGLSGDEVLERIDARDVDPMVAMVTAVEPDVDIAEMPFDAYVTKALDRATVRETVERLVARAEYDDLLREHYAVAEKLATIEERTTRTERQASERYQALSERFATLDEQLSTHANALDRDELTSLDVGAGGDDTLSGADEPTDEDGDTT